MEYTFDFSTGVSPYPVWLCSMDIGTALDRVSVSARKGSCRGGRGRTEARGGREGDLVHLSVDLYPGAPIWFRLYPPPALTHT